MGNWLKGRVLIIPDNTQQGEQVGVGGGGGIGGGSTTNTSNAIHHQHHYYSHHPHHHQPHNHQSYTSELTSNPIYCPPYSSYSEEDQIQIAKRIGLIQHLPTGIYSGNSGDGSTKNLRECVICMVEFSKGDSIRFLPCLHTYHSHCIDDWLMRSFICPCCMEPVDVALLNTL